jgi:Flp pilus assembly pilin Flp
MRVVLRALWQENDGQDIAEYTLMLAAILALTLSVVRLIGSNASSVLSRVASAIQ